MNLHLACGPIDAWAIGHAQRAMPGVKVHLAMSGEGGPNHNCGGQQLGESMAGVKVNLVASPGRDPDQNGGELGPLARGVGTPAAPLRLRILLSYHYYRDVDLDVLFTKYFTEPYPEVFADSGGFSAMTQGAKIDRDEYAAWLKRWRHRFTTYANLDVIRDHRATAFNQAYLEDRGLAPLPVFHGGSPYEVLERLIERYPYIALGGLVGFSRVYLAHLAKCFRMARGKAVFHGFGVTSWTALKSLPWYSVDSSTWGQGFRFGTVPLFDERRGTWQKLQLGNLALWRKNRWQVERLGFNPDDFGDRARNDRAKICAVAALSYMLAERWLRSYHGPVHVPNNADGPAGPLVHLVTATGNSNMSCRALGEAGIDGDNTPGPRLHLADARPWSGEDLSNADSGLKTYLGTPRDQSSYVRDIGPVDAGLKTYLAEHSLDRGGLGDTSRAWETLNP